MDKRDKRSSRPIKKYEKYEKEKHEKEEDEEGENDKNPEKSQNFKAVTYFKLNLYNQRLALTNQTFYSGESKNVQKSWRPCGFGKKYMYLNTV